MVIADVALARRLERAEAEASRRFVETRARLQPDVGATWMEVAGAYAMFDGAQSPLTQTFGLGLFDEVTDDHLATLESFFESRGAAVHHEVSPLGPIDLQARLARRGYTPVEFTSVLYQELPRRRVTGSSDVAVTRVSDADGQQRWAATAAAGWADVSADLADFIGGIATVNAAAPGTAAFLATVDGLVAASALLWIHEGVALLAGASTVAASRGRGAQRALLDARLAAAAEAGCELAMMGAAPGSASQRNAEREGFRVAYTRMKWQRR
ncbi:MAG: hypothetical protein AB7P99_09755 [Vicinamibacterales bacterium]